MKTKTLRGFGLIGALTMASAGAWLACGDDTGNGTTPTDGGSDSTGSSSGTSSSSGSSGGKGSSSSGGKSSSSGSGSGGSSSGTASSSGAGSDAGDAGDAAAAVSCATYCATIQAACTGANQQYASNDECMNACKYFDTADADMGNTLLCHNEHANNAKMLANPHCWHAGPYGWGVCGDQCGDFCNLATQYCSPAGGFPADSGPPPYPSLSACTTACAMFFMNGGDAGLIVTDAGDASGNSYTATGPGSGNTLDCREYHLGAALQSTMLQQLHCLHPGVNSPTCM